MLPRIKRKNTLNEENIEANKINPSTIIGKIENEKQNHSLIRLKKDTNTMQIQVFLLSFCIHKLFFYKNSNDFLFDFRYKNYK